MATKLLTLEELAQMLRLNPQTVYRLAQKGKIEGIKVGGSWRFDADSLIAALRRTSKSEDDA
jgi:excisionase family DNA binding protein